MGPGFSRPFPFYTEIMQRHRVPRIKQTFTIQGMSLGDILISALLLYLGWKLAGFVSGHPMVKLVGAAVIFYLGMGFYRSVAIRYPPGFFSNYFAWLIKPDVFVPMPDEKVQPLIVPARVSDNKEDEEGALRDYRGQGGEHPERATAS